VARLTLARMRHATVKRSSTGPERTVPPASGNRAGPFTRLRLRLMRVMQPGAAVLHDACPARCRATSRPRPDAADGSRVTRGVRHGSRESGSHDSLCEPAARDPPASPTLPMMPPNRPALHTRKHGPGGHRSSRSQRDTRDSRGRVTRRGGRTDVTGRTANSSFGARAVGRRAPGRARGVPPDGDGGAVVSARSSPGRSYRPTLAVHPLQSFQPALLRHEARSTFAPRRNAWIVARPSVSYGVGRPPPTDAPCP